MNSMYHDLAAGMPKRCAYCGAVKTWADFSADCTSPDGYSYWCKVCRNAAARARYHRDIEWSRHCKRLEYRRNGARRRAARKAWDAFLAEWRTSTGTA